MKKGFRYSVCFIFLLAFWALIANCGGGGGNSGSSSPGLGGGGSTSQPTAPGMITTADLVAAKGKSTTFHIPDDIDFYVIKADSTDGGINYTLTLKFQNSKGRVRGFSAYIFSSTEIEVNYNHPDKWQTMKVKNPPAGYQVLQEKSLSSIQNCWLIGSSLNTYYQDLGEITIKTPAKNEHNFVLYAYYPQ